MNSTADGKTALTMRFVQDGLLFTGKFIGSMSVSRVTGENQTNSQSRVAMHSGGRTAVLQINSKLVTVTKDDSDEDDQTMYQQQDTTPQRPRPNHPPLRPANPSAPTNMAQLRQQQPQQQAIEYPQDRKRPHPGPSPPYTLDIADEIPFPEKDQYANSNNYRRSPQSVPAPRSNSNNNAGFQPASSHPDIVEMNDVPQKAWNDPISVKYAHILPPRCFCGEICTHFWSVHKTPQEEFWRCPKEPREARCKYITSCEKWLEKVHSRDEARAEYFEQN